MSRPSSYQVVDQNNLFDIISELHRRLMYHVLQLIFEYLDRESLLHIELTSKDWKTAISDAGNQKKLWETLLQQKVASSTLWKSLHFHIAPTFSKSLDAENYFFREMFIKIEFTIKALRQNWLECKSTRGFGNCEVVRSCFTIFFKLNNMFIVLWNSAMGNFKIWNRVSLKFVEEVWCFETLMWFQNNLRFELFDDALIYSLRNTIIVRNLSTKNTSIHMPFGNNENIIINYLRAQGGFLAAVTCVKDQTHSCQNAYIWRLNSPTDINWETVTIIPILLNPAKKCVIFMDQNFLIFLMEEERRFSSKWKCEIRKMAKPEQKGTYLSLPQTKHPVIYFEGDLMMVNEKGKIVVVDMESGASLKNVIQPKANLLDPDTRVTMSSSGFIFVCSNVGCSDAIPSGIEMWDFKALKDTTAKLPHKPLMTFKTFIGLADLLYADEFGFVTAQYHSHFSESDCTIREINFLPFCNFCKEIRQRFSKCSRCKFAKYCGSSCQKADWQHHKEICRREESWCHH